jgi:hypothetical protein
MDNPRLGSDRVSGEIGAGKWSKDPQPVRTRFSRLVQVDLSHTVPNAAPPCTPERAHLVTLMDGIVEGDV